MTSKQLTIEYCGLSGFGRTALAIDNMLARSFGKELEIHLSSSPRRTGIICVKYGAEEDSEVVWVNTRKQTEAKMDQITAQVRNLLERDKHRE